MSEPKEPTVEEMVEWLDEEIKCLKYRIKNLICPDSSAPVFLKDLATLQAIREHLEKQTVSRDNVVLILCHKEASDE